MEQNKEFHSEPKPYNRTGYKIVRAIGGMVLAIILVCVLIISKKMDHTPLLWWEYLEPLFIFLAAFCRLCSLLYVNKLPAISKRFNLLAIIFLVLTVVMIIVDWFINRG